MNLFNKKILAHQIGRYDFPHTEELQKLQSHLSRLQAFIKDEDLNRTQEIKVQGTFLVRVFSDVLGYSVQLDNNDQWTLEQHPKTEVDAQVADGGLGIFTKESKKYIAVIELKDAKTSLDKKQSGRSGKLTPVEQAFQYLNKFDGCKWAIVSNFREIRIYSKLRGQGFYEKFDIVDLTQEHEFKRFYYILNKHNLIDDGQKSVIDNLVEDTTSQEENITKKFYEQYKEIRLQVLNHLSKHNPDVDRLSLVEKTQKLLDRLIFILVCEDTSTLLPAHLITNTYERAFQSFALSNSDQRVWSEFKGLFHAIDEGNNNVVPPINKYNGGLFKTDKIFDQLIIKDEIWKEIVKLTQYDFESDLNVNVLGHIFEQSISDLEEIRESILLIKEDDNGLLTENGQKIILEQDSVSLVEKKGKRKRMGIFYTPEYITKFIVENTVGRYIEDNPNKLESVKILDPACGSGAFLNQAHSFLLNEYKIRVEQKQLDKLEKGERLTLWDTNTVENDKSILLNNLFGVDLSPESVDITKLALWLKTAKATEPLQNLDNNIKCGNSLIDDPAFAGDKSFDWNHEFKEIMDQGGFDVIVGNPPYVRSEYLKNQSNYLEKNYETYQGKNDIYVYFFEKSLKLLKPNGIMGFIVSSKFTKTNYAKGLRQFIKDNSDIVEFIDFNDLEVFDGVTAYPCIIILRKKKMVKNSFAYRNITVLPSDELDIVTTEATLILQSDLSEKQWAFKKNVVSEILKTKKNLIPFLSVFNKPGVGIKTGYNDGFVFDNESLLVKNLVNSSQLQDYVFGKDVGKYYLETKHKVIFPYSYDDKQLHLIDEKDLDPQADIVLNGNRQQLESRAIINEGIKNGTKKWFEFQQINRSFDSSKTYIIYPNVSNTSSFCFSNGKFIDMTCFFIELKNEDQMAYLPVLNSKLIDLYHAEISIERRGGYRENKTQYIEQTLLPPLNENDRNQLISFCQNRIRLEIEFQEARHNFQSLIEQQYGKLEPKTKINNINSLGWNEFIEFLESNRISLTISDKEKIMLWYKNKQSMFNKQQEEILALDREINYLVYDLYGLSKDEIALVEST